MEEGWRRIETSNPVLYLLVFIYDGDTRCGSSGAGGGEDNGDG